LDVLSVLRTARHCGTTTSTTGNGSPSRCVGWSGCSLIAKRRERRHSRTSGSPARPDAPFRRSAASLPSLPQHAFPPAGWRQLRRERQAWHVGADVAWTPGVRMAARSRQWVELRCSSRRRPTADGCLPLPSLRPAARLREPIGQLFSDVRACEAIHREFASADRLDLMGGDGREDESVGYHDRKRFSNSGRACS
jgi:hypothetical protein